MTEKQLDALATGDTFTYRGRSYSFYGWAGTTYGARNGREYARLPVFAKGGGKSFVTVYLTGTTT
jgi:hypothetical protein